MIVNAVDDESRTLSAPADIAYAEEFRGLRDFGPEDDPERLGANGHRGSTETSVRSE
jgi:hypothetical protein